MKRSVLVIEPDAAGRRGMERVLASEGLAVATSRSFAEARAILSADPPIDVAIVDEVGARGVMLEEARALRREYPAVAAVVVGGLLAPPVLEELVRLGVSDLVRKPFTPGELREAVGRALAARAPAHDEALEYAAAVAAARRALGSGRLIEAASTLRRARGVAPFDAEPMALAALVAELLGRDGDADRGYRAALALRDSEDEGPPDPHEGLARLAAYGAARPVRELDAEHAGAPIRLVRDPVRELAEAAALGGARAVVAMGVGLAKDAPGALFLRAGAGPLAFALFAGQLPAGEEAVRSALLRAPESGGAP